MSRKWLGKREPLMHIACIMGFSLHTLHMLFFSLKVKDNFHKGLFFTKESP